MQTQVAGGMGTWRWIDLAIEKQRKQTFSLFLFREKEEADVAIGTFFSFRDRRENVVFFFEFFFLYHESIQRS